MSVDRCVCRELTFERLKREAEAHGITSVEVLARRLDFGSGCGLCIPYVEAMLATGQTVFTEIMEGTEGRVD